MTAGTMAWPATAHFAPLIEEEVHVWLADLGHGAESFERLARVLSEDERERAARFHFQRDAIRWTVSRVVLRSILGQYLDVEPHAVRFRAGPWGKPELAVPLERQRLQFNASHSDGLGLYTVASSRRVGVDIERLRPLPDLEAIAGRMFSPHEQQALGGLPRAKRPAAFFSCWTRKEAYIKALGDGLAYPLERFTVSLTPDAPAKLEDVQDNPAEVGRWSLTALAPAPGYAAALAIEGRPARLLCAQWQERAC
jgi:4'-phosphopantetheinyl transferase